MTKEQGGITSNRISPTRGTRLCEGIPSGQTADIIVFMMVERKMDKKLRINLYLFHTRAHTQTCWCPQQQLVEGAEQNPSKALLQRPCGHFKALLCSL
ncbi:hypothetical protein IRJ41_004286 [Triplophysa rosa]|uniref:Uncharacterized protein n=1 Tax=Triplophysa rosa TaxID=992332 RepID=A0A9W7TWA3_TRIRA|nr:hypothetical protein IRJ41_004286 [Triplophysa rosa]